MTDKVTPNDAPVSSIEGLTTRQHQILELMQQGKVNKEIARDLDITLGTVKQHLVAIFKKLNVQNRTMAVARLAEFKDQSGFDQVFSGETLVAMRPCIVLSLKVNGDYPLSALKRFHTCLSEMAFDCNALFISSETGEGDLIFGLKRSSAQDMRMATLVASHVNQVMADFVQAECKQAQIPVLQGALVAGLVSVSQNRFGGWSGENVGSHVLAWGHQLRDSAKAGCLCLDKPVIGVMKAFDLTASESLPEQISFSDLARLNDWDSVDSTDLVGRDDELSLIQKLLDDHFRILVLEGENGMGKSRLCREAGRRALAAEMPLLYIRVLPIGYLDSGSYRYFEHWQDIRSRLEETGAKLLIVDDAHHLTSDGKADMTASLNQLPGDVRVLISGRQPLDFAFSPAISDQVQQLHLLRLNESDLDVFFESKNVRADLIERCRGIPLFARELALDHGNTLSLALLITVASRIDKFKVDWKLLYCVAAHDIPVSIDRLSMLMQDEKAYIKAALKRAVNLGVLSVGPQGASFNHPLVKDVVHYLFKSNLSSIAASRAS